MNALTWSDIAALTTLAGVVFFIVWGCVREFHLMTEIDEQARSGYLDKEMSDCIAQPMVHQSHENNQGNGNNESGKRLRLSQRKSGDRDAERRQQTLGHEAGQFDIHPNQTADFKNQLMKRSA